MKMRAITATALIALLAVRARATGQFQQETDAQFDAGSYLQTYRSGTGAAAAVGLDYSGRAAGLAAPGGAAWYAPAWAYRRPVTILSTNASTLTDYQVPLSLDTLALISAGRMKADGSDLRFTASDGTTPLSHYVESGLGTASTVVWVKVSTVSASATTTVYMYYGNAAASDAASLSSTFVFGDDFSGADGSAPDAGRWSSIYVSSNAASVREVRSGQLHYSYGGYAASGYYGLTSVNAQSYAQGRRYRVAIDATTIGSGQKSSINLCTQNNDCFSSLGFVGSWLGFTITHSTPAYKLERANGSGIVTVVANTSTTSSLHQVEFLMRAGNYQVKLDGSSIASGALTTFTPYIHLEAGSSTSTLKDFHFDTMLVTQYSLPEPAMSGVGAEQGAYSAEGTYSSAVLDAATPGTRFHFGNWAAAVPAGTGLLLEARAADASIDAGTWTAVAAGADPGLAGRYFQYRASFTATDARYTAALDSATFAYTSAPSVPADFAGAALSSTSISWNWTDSLSGQFEEDGFRVKDGSGVVLASLARGQAFWLESSLTPNTSYQRMLEAYNFVASSETVPLVSYTLPPVATITSAKSTGTWYGSGNTFEFTNVSGFGPGAVTAYRYAWTTSPTHSFIGSEPLWNSGTLTVSTGVSGQYYLHAQPLNAAGNPGPLIDLGTFGYDSSTPTVTGFTPSSAPWSAAAASVDISLADSGGAGLRGVQHLWRSSTDTPAGGWPSLDTSVSGNSAAVNRIQFSEGTWYLHAQTVDNAGQTGYAYSGPYRVDVTSPTGSVAINAGASYVSTTSVTLGLTYADSVSGVASVRYRNVPGAFSAYEAPASTRAWDLTASTGTQTVEYQIVDSASNTATYQAAVLYSRQTGLAVTPQVVSASGETPEQTTLFSATGGLSFAPTGAGIAGRSVSFQLQAASGSAVTNGAGTAVVNFGAPASSGVYQMSGAFAGDATFDASAATAALTVLPRSSFLVVPPASATVGSTVTLSVTLLDLATVTGLSAKPVSISFRGSTQTALTDAFGIVSATFSAPASSGSYAYSASYVGGAVYGAVSQSNTVMNNRRGVLVLDNGTAGTPAINQAYVLSAQLFDQESSDRISGRTIVFEVAGASATGVTNALGVATAAFTTASSGTFNSVATFTGDSVYGVDGDTTSVTIIMRPTTVTPVALSTAVGSFFTVGAFVKDTLSLAPLVGSTGTFTFLTSSSPFTADALGYAEASFTAPLTTGTYAFSVASAGGPINVAGTSPGTLTVVRHLTQTTVTSLSAQASVVFIATATLVDLASGTALAGQSFVFEFQGSTAAGVTDSSGAATAAFTAPGSVGSYSLVATYLGDANYAASSATGTISVNTRATTLTGLAVSAAVGTVFTTSATLTETALGVPVGGKTVRFVFAGTPQTVITDGAGLAAASFTAPPSSGTYSYYVDFLGDSLYMASADTRTVTATPRPLAASPAPAAAGSGDVFTATATVLDSLSGAPVVGLPVVLTFQAVSSTVSTDGSGVAVATFTAPVSTGTYLWTVSYGGDAVNASASNSASLVVSARASQLTAQTVNVVTNKVFTATATLVDFASGSPLSGRTLSFSFNGSTLPAVTNGSGVATRTFTAPVSTGSYSYSTWYAGTALQASVTTFASVTVIRLPIFMSGLDVQTTVDAQFNLQETLVEIGTGLPLAGVDVSFSFYGSTQGVTTNAAGVAIATFTAPSVSTMTTFVASFAGDGTYAPASDTRQVAVGFRYTVTVPFNTFGLAQDVSTFTAKLIDLQDSSPLAGRTLSLNIQSTTHTAVTDANGLCLSTFTLPSASGTYALNGTFAGESFFLASAATATITVLTRPNLMWGNYSYNDLDRLATLGPLNGGWALTDSNSFSGIAGRPIEVVYLSSTYTVTTNGSGNFTLGSLGLQTSTIAATNTMTFRFYGDSTYSSSTLSFPVAVVPRYVWMNVDGQTVNAGLSFDIGAQLTDSVTAAKIASKAYTFYFNGSSRTVTADTSGYALASFTAPASTGIYLASATFAGDQTYGNSWGVGNVTVINRQSMLVSNFGGSCGVGLTCPFGSFLTDLDSGVPIFGATVTYHVLTATYTAPTDASGSATFPMAAFSALGNYTVYSNFAGDGVYLAVYSTTTLPVVRRPTLLSAASVPVQRLDVFSLSSGLQEYLYQSASVVGGTVTFVFNGSTYTALTDAFGTATTTASAPSALGTYPYSVSFVQDSTFTASANAGSVVVGKRDTQLSASNASPSFSETFYATAQLQDGATPIAGATITFTFQGSSHTAFTDAIGVASAALVAPAATGTYPFTAYYDGSALYNTSTGTASAFVDRRISGLGSDNLATAILSSFTARATLSDGLSGAPRSGLSVVFGYAGSSAAAVTDALGVATATFVAASIGETSYSATYLGDALYYPASSTGTLTLNLRATTLIGFDQTPAVNQGFSATAQLKDFETGAAILGSTLTFTFQASTKSAPTGASGQASAAYTAPAAVGTYGYTAYYPGSAVYLASTGTANVIVDQRGVSLTPASVSADEGDIFQTQATFIDQVSGLPVSGATVTFVFNSTTQTVLTDAFGVAAATFTAPASSGTYIYSASFAGDASYVPMSANASVTVSRRATSLIVSNVGVLIGDSWTASATLVDSASGVPISTLTVSLSFAGSTQTAATNGAGIASVVFSSVSTPGTYPITAAFVGNSTYTAASGAGTLTVYSRATRVTLTSPNAYPGEVFLATATLADIATGDPIAARTVVLQFQASSGTAVTNAAGAAGVYFGSPASTGPFSVVGTFLGAGAYAASSATGTVNVLQRPTSVSVSNAAAILSSSFTASMTLSDTRLAAGISGATVAFVFNGATQTVLTNGLGQATTTFAAPVSAGTYALTAAFAATALYQASAGIASVTVTLRPTLSAATPVTTTANSLFTASMQLKDTTANQTLSGKTLVFAFAGSTQAVATNGSGIASTSFSAPATSGTYSFSGTFVGDAVYGFSSDTATVVSGQRPLSLGLPNYPTNASDPFSPVATVTDQAAGTPVAGLGVSFVFEASTQTGTTNGLGQATTNYFSPAGTGAYPLTAAYSGNATYAAVFASATVTVASFGSTIAVANATATVAQAFIATATLRATLGLVPLSGSSVTFTMNGSSQTAYTNALGVATVTFAAPASAGTYSLVSTFGGDGTYMPSSATGTLTALTAPTILANVPPFTVSALTVITATATMTRATDSTPVAGRTVNFTFQSVNNSGVTDASGVARATFTAFVSGVSNWTGSFPGDSGLGASSTATAVTVTKLVTDMAALPVSTFTLSNFTAQATLTVNGTGAVVKNRAVSFMYAGVSSATVTNNSGVATVVYNAGVSAGAFTYSATFPGDATYITQSATGAVTLTARPTSLASPAVSLHANDFFVASATVTDSVSGAGVSAVTVEFTYLGAPAYVATNANGMAWNSYSAGSSSGSYTYVSSFTATSAYLASSGTFSVTVLPRPTSFTSVPAVTVPVDSVFTASATLTDVLTGAPLNARPVVFAFQTSTQAATTNASGLATALLPSGAATGGYSFSVTLSSGPTYAGVSSTAAVTVTPRPTTISPQNVPSIHANDVFTATATLRDFLTSAAVSGRTLSFVYKGASSASVTNASGDGTVTYNAGVSSGTYTYSATFSGDAGYSAQSATATVTVLPRPTLTQAAAVASVYANNFFVASATVTDVVNGGLPIAGLPVSFVYQGVSSATITTAAGLASVSYNAGLSSGPWTYSASVSSGATYGASAAVAAVTVNPRPTSLATLDVAAVSTLNVFTATATLTDSLTTNPISGVLVWFNYKGSLQSMATNGSGVATYVYAAGTSSGPYSYSATFSPTALYLGQSSTSTVTVLPRVTSLAATAVPAAYPLGVFTASATLTDTVTSGAIAGKTISFVYNGTVQSAGTIASGLATTVYSVGASSGPYQFSATFSPDVTYVGNSATGTVTALPRPTLLVSVPVVEKVNAVFTASATLTDVRAGTLVAGQTVAFDYLGVSSASLTNASGLATVSYNTGLSSGPYSFSATLSSGPVYAGVSSTGTVTVVVRPTLLAATAVPSVLANATFIATATLTDQLGGVPVEGKSVSFLYLGVSSSSLTNAAGEGTVTYNAGSSSGPYTYSATFVGDAMYGVKSATGNVTVKPRPTSLANTAIPPVYVYDVFGATSTLTDVTSASIIAGQTLKFAYRGSSAAMATDGSGVASGLFGAGSSSGTYSLSVTLSSGPTYGGVSSTSSVTVLPRPTLLLATALAPLPTLTVFTASATLQDVNSGSFLPGKSISFVYLGVSSASLTNASGLATVTYNSNTSSGTKSFSATLSSGAAYSGQSSTATFTVNPRATTMATNADARAFAGGVYLATATLRDQLTNAVIAGKPLSFAYLSVSSTPLTNASGLASANYSAGASSGTYTYSATFVDDATYTGQSSTGTVVVAPRSTLVAASAVANVRASTVFTASATLTDLIPPGGAVSGQTVWFSFGGASSSSLTNASGLATVTYTAPVSSAVYSFSATLSSGAYYAGQSSTATVTVLPRVTALAAAAVPSVYTSQLFIATATLTDVTGGGTPLAGRTVSFLYLGASSSSLTNASGEATVTYNAGPSSGPYTYSATAVADASYAVSSATGTVTVAARPSLTAATAVPSVYVSALFIASATVTDTIGSVPVPGATVSFLFQGVSSTSLTNAAGLATVTYTAPVSSAVYSFSATALPSAGFGGSSSTATVTTLPRPTLMASPNRAVFANNSFVAMTTLTDSISGLPVAGRGVSFMYLAVSSASPTVATGASSATYSAGASSGSYSYSATFLGDSSYVTQSATGTVTVSPRPTTLVSLPVGSAPALDPFTAAATLTDVLSGLPVSGQSIWFAFKASVSSAATNGAGLAATTLPAGASSGTYSFSATLSSGPLYAGISSTAAVTVVPRAVGLSMPNTVTLALGVFTASATLTDSITTAGISGQTVSFVFQGATQTATTNGLGLATTAYTVLATTGTYVVTSTFPANVTYTASAASATVTVAQRLTAIAGSAASAYALEPFISSATLTDLLLATPVVGRGVDFSFSAASSSGATIGSGLATGGFTAPASSGSYSYDAAFAGDSTYGPVSTAAVTVAVLARPTSLSSTTIPSVYTLGVFTATATLRDVRAATTVAGRTVSFLFQSVTHPVASDGAGLAATSYTAGASSGVYSYTASFAGDANYSGSAAPAGTVTLQPRPTVIAPLAASSYALNVFKATATLTDGLTSAPISGRTLYFQYGASSGAVATNGAGQAFWAFPAGSSTGTLSFSATLLADPTYTAQSATAAVSINSRPVSVAQTPVSAYVSTLFVASATLTDKLSGMPLAGQDLDFIFQGATQTATTNGAGLATASFTPALSSGTYALDVVFSTTAVYVGTSTLASVPVLRRPVQLLSGNVLVNALDPFPAGALLTDFLSGAAIVGESVSFVYEGSTLTAVTQPDGVAMDVFTAPGSSGTTVYTASYLGSSMYSTATVSALVTTQPRLSTITAPGVTVFALDVFTASATISDFQAETPISGGPVRFDFQSVASTSSSDGAGLAVSTFSAPASSGAYTVSASFLGTPANSSTSTTAGVTVLARPLSVAVSTASAYVFSNFTATATLTDGFTSAPVSGRSLAFLIGSVTTYATTDGSGRATASVAAPAPAASYALEVSYAGDATYQTVYGSAAVVSSLRPVILVSTQLAPIPTPALDALALAATLTDGVSSATLTGRTLRFVLLSATQTATTDGLGAGATSYIGVASSGSYVYSAAFDGDASYSSASVLGTALISQRATRMTAQSMTTFGGAVFTATGTLRDNASNALLAGKSVLIHFDDGSPLGLDFPATTSAFGQAVATFTAPAATGLFQYTASYPGDATYGVSIDTGFVQIGLLSTLLIADANTVVLDSFTVSAKLLDPFTQPIVGKSITFTFQGSSVTTLTDAAGVARSTFSAPSSSGTYPMAARFDGDITYAPSNGLANVNVALRATTLSSIAAFADVGSTVTLSARLRDNVTGGGVAGKDVTFTLQGTTVSAVTDAAGQAAAPFAALSSSGSYVFTALFAGDTIYATAVDESTAAITLVPSAVLAFAAATPPGMPATFSARLISLRTGAGLPGLPIEFSFGASSAAAVTGASGDASAVFTAPSSSGTYSYGAYAVGNSTYAAATASGTLAVGLRLTAMALSLDPAYPSVVFAASATVSDLTLSTVVPGALVSFVFAGTTVVATADAWGVARATFAAGASTGSFALSADYAGDATFTASTAAASVLVSLRPTLADASAAAPAASALFTATGTFTDALSGLPLTGVPVVFAFQASTAAGVTDAFGSASALFGAPSSSGSFSYTAAYAGTAQQAPATATGTVTVTQIGTLTIVDPVAALLDGPVDVRAKVLLQSDGSALPGLTVVFQFSGASATATTDALGFATAAFTASGTLGVYRATAAFAGAGVYAGSLGFNAVTVATRPTSLALPDVAAVALQVFTATMTLRDSSTGAGLAGKTLDFYFEGSTFTATTDSFGVALATFMAPGSTGTYALDGLFAGTTVYLSSAAHASVTINSGGGSGGSGGGSGTFLTLLDLNATVARAFTASATLAVTGTLAPVAGRSVSFVFNGSTLTTTTDAVGVASAAFIAPASSQTMPITALFAGDGSFNAAFSSATVFVLPEPTRLQVPDVLTSSGTVFTATATLTVALSSAPLPARALSFSFEGATVTATTDGSGVALATFTAPTSSGSYVLLVSYSGDASYAMTSASAAVVVQASGGGGGSSGGSGGGNSVLVLFPAPVTPAVYSTVFVATAALYDPALDQGVGGRLMSFVFQGSTSTVVTDGSGVAQATFTAPASFGPYVLSAYFVGDSTYVAASATNTVVVGLGLVPADPGNVAASTVTATQIVVVWDPVTLSVNGVGMSSEVVRYDIERSTDMSAAWKPLLSVSSGLPTTVALSTSVADFWLRVVAVSREGYRSPGQAAIHLTSYAAPARVFLSADHAAWIEVPAAAEKDLSAGGVSRTIVISSISAPGYTFAYSVRVHEGLSEAKDFTFKNSYNGVRFIVSIDRAREAQGMSAAAFRPKDNNQLALYFWSGVEWVKLGAVEDVRSGQASITLRRPGNFAAGFAPLAGAFSLTKVAPRVFTPEEADANVNRARFYFENPENSEVNIKIFDIAGAVVRGTVARENSNILYWDGRDDSGKPVKAGVYIYQIETGGKAKTGTIAVAK